MADNILLWLLDTEDFFNLIIISLSFIFCRLLIQSDRIDGLVLFFNLVFFTLIIRSLNITLDYISFCISLMLVKSF